MSTELEQSFPGLTIDNHKLTSPKAFGYNCVAWAVGDTKNVWDYYRIKGRRVKGYFWPDGISVDTLDGWKAVFREFGYSESESGKFEEEFEKVAIYVLDGEPSHVARQLGSGKWSSKLGWDFDIEHDTLDSLEGEVYGKVAVIMQRPCKDGKRVPLP